MPDSHVRLGKPVVARIFVYIYYEINSTSTDEKATIKMMSIPLDVVNDVAGRQRVDDVLSPQRTQRHTIKKKSFVHEMDSKKMRLVFFLTFRVMYAYGDTYVRIHRIWMTCTNMNETRLLCSLSSALFE